MTKDWLKEEIKKEQALFIMDYQSGLDDCKSQIEISVLDIESLSRAINAMYIYQEYTGITDTEIKRYKESQNSRFFSWANIIKLNDNSKLDINIYLKSRY